MPPINVKIEVTGSGAQRVTVFPSHYRVPAGAPSVTLTWRAVSGTTFLPEPDCFEWKPSSGPTPPVVTRVDDTTLQAVPYDNNFGVRVVWEYLVGVQKDGVKIQVDPEVDNEPPRPGEDYTLTAPDTPEIPEKV